MNLRLQDSVEPTEATKLNEVFMKTKQLFSTNNQLRLRRSISWLERAQEIHESGDYDVSFILHWISFNAMFARGGFESQGQQYKAFIKRIVELDTSGTIGSTLRPMYGPTIHKLLNNRYMFRVYWNQDYDHTSSSQETEEWKEKRKQLVHTISRGLTEGRDVDHALNCLFDLLYVLRNQLLHGLSTFNGSLNRAQVNNGVAILHRVIPRFIVIMLDSPDENWGAAQYPPVQVLPKQDSSRTASRSN